MLEATNKQLREALDSNSSLEQQLADARRRLERTCFSPSLFVFCSLLLRVSNFCQTIYYDYVQNRGTAAAARRGNCNADVAAAAPRRRLTSSREYVANFVFVLFIVSKYLFVSVHMIRFVDDFHI